MSDFIDELKQLERKISEKATLTEISEILKRLESEGNYAETTEELAAAKCCAGKIFDYFQSQKNVTPDYADAYLQAAAAFFSFHEDMNDVSLIFLDALRAEKCYCTPDIMLQCIVLLRSNLAGKDMENHVNDVISDLCKSYTPGQVVHAINESTYQAALGDTAARFIKYSYDRAIKNEDDRVLTQTIQALAELEYRADSEIMVSEIIQSCIDIATRTGDNRIINEISCSIADRWLALDAPLKKTITRAWRNSNIDSIIERLRKSVADKKNLSKKINKIASENIHNTELYKLGVAAFELTGDIELAKKIFKLWESYVISCRKESNPIPCPWCDLFKLARKMSYENIELARELVLLLLVDSTDDIDDLNKLAHFIKFDLNDSAWAADFISDFELEQK